MLQGHKAGEKVFVDYAGHAESVWNAECAARVFVAVLGRVRTATRKRAGAR